MAIKRKKSFIAIIFMLAIGLILLLWTTAKELNLFPISKVNVTGKFSFVKKTEIEKKLLPFVNTGFFNFKLKGAYQSLKKLPGVKTISIRRVWPDSIFVHIQEYKAIGNWENTKLIDTNGNFFSMPRADFPKHIPLFIGNSANKDELFNFNTIATPLLAPLNLSISILVLDNHGAWHLKLSPGFWLHLGSQKPALKLNKFIHTYQQIKKKDPNKKIAYIDMNYPNAYALKWTDKTG